MLRQRQTLAIGLVAAIGSSCAAAIDYEQRAAAIAGCYQFDRSVFSSGIFRDQTGYPNTRVHRAVQLHLIRRPWQPADSNMWVVTVPGAPLDSAHQAEYAKRSYWQVRGRDSVFVELSTGYMLDRHLYLAVRRDSLIGAMASSSDIGAKFEVRGDQTVMVFPKAERTPVTAARVRCKGG